MLSLHTQTERLTLTELFARFDVTKVETEGRGPDADLIFRVKMDGELVSFWVSPRHNFLVRKRGWVSEKADLHSETEVVRFHEPEPGVFFPARVESTTTAAGSRVPIRTITYSEVALNKPYPPDIFVLKFPRGAYLLNQFKNQTYETDEDGKPLGKVTPVPEAAIMPTSPLDKSAPPPLTETKDEPQSWSRYILPISLGILALAAVAWIARRRVRAAT